MTTNKDLGTGGKAAIAGAIGSAALAAVLLYVRHRKEREERSPYTNPAGEAPETD
jgi:hypothetical protein